MFHIKICGIRTSADVEAVAESSADAVGLNFFPPSVRYLDPSDAKSRRLARQALDAGLHTVGVFVNEAPDKVLEIADRLELCQVQLHGDEPIETAETLIKRGASVIRAIKLARSPDGSYPIAERTQAWIDAGCELLLDADAGAAHGGSGQTLDWEQIQRWSDAVSGRRWVLAGGLDVDNVARAIGASGAGAVDVASGVEQPRGQKSPALIHQFSEAAQSALGGA